MLKVQLKKAVKFALGRPAVSETTIDGLIIQMVQKEVVGKDSDGNPTTTKKMVPVMRWNVGEGGPGANMACTTEVPASLIQPLFDLATKVTQDTVDAAASST